MKIIYWQMTYLFKMESVMNYLYYTGCFARTFTHLHGSLVTCNTRSRSSSTVKSPIPAGLILRSRCGDLADDSMHVIHIYIYVCVYVYAFMHLFVCLFFCLSIMTYLFTIVLVKIPYEMFKDIPMFVLFLV